MPPAWLKNPKAMVAAWRVSVPWSVMHGLTMWHCINMWDVDQIGSILNSSKEITWAFWKDRKHIAVDLDVQCKRWKGERKSMPDFLCIDGWKGFFSTAVTALRAHASSVEGFKQCHCQCIVQICHMHVHRYTGMFVHTLAHTRATYAHTYATYVHTYAHTHTDTYTRTYTRHVQK
jgi:hypothetical protein